MTPIPFALYVSLSLQLTGWGVLLAGIVEREAGNVAVGCALLVITTIIMFTWMKSRAVDKGRSAQWGWMSLLNLVGLIVILMLSVRQRPQGFEVQPVISSANATKSDVH
jgi:hypothetical protein